MTKSVVAYALAVLAAASLSAFPGERAAAGNDPLFSRLAERSWLLQEPARAFTPANLYEEIDGEAELFLPYGFRELTVGYLSGKKGAGSQLRLELYLHASPLDAFGIYSQHRFPGQETVSIGPSEGIVSDASLDFFRGNRFVRIRAASPETSRGDIIELGLALSDLLEGTGAPPPETGALFVEGFIPGTLVYQKKAVLGYGILAPGYEAKFSAGEAKGSLLLLPPGNGAVSRRSAESVAGGFAGATRIGAGFYRAEMPGGSLWLMESGAYLLGAAGKISREAAERVLSEMARNLPR